MKISGSVIRLDLAPSKDNTLLDLNNSSDDTQPRSIIANYASLLAMELEKLLVNEKSEPRVKQICLPNSVSNITNNKNELCQANKFSKTTIAIRFNLLQDCPSVATIPFAVFFIPSFHVCRSYFHVSLNFVAVLTVLFSFVKFRDAAL